MKKILMLVLISCFLLSASQPVKAQSDDVVQLLLNWKKLKQLREILDNMYKGYKILTKGYKTIKDISEGNFKLHEVFLNGLLEVNPKIKDYYRIVQIIEYQKLLVKEYKQAWDYFKSNQHFTPDEIFYIEKVYSELFKRSLKDLDELIMVTTASKLRMSDDERLQAIDRIFLEMEDKLAFLQYFNNSTRLLVVQRTKALNEVNTSEKLYEGD